uniref:Uncharacterized protein n=1 Tax=Lygus hesperus TaxID=30085 RepID=A0A0A9Z9I1_LYGHE
MFSPSKTTLLSSPPSTLGLRSNNYYTGNTTGPVSPLAAATAATTRLFGVDELDYPYHRLGSPSMTPGSPHVKPVVDPMAPVRHNNASFSQSSSGTLSPPSTHLSSVAAVATDAVMVNLDLTSSL